MDAQVHASRLWLDLHDLSLSRLGNHVDLSLVRLVLNVGLSASVTRHFILTVVSGYCEKAT